MKIARTFYGEVEGVEFPEKIKFILCHNFKTKKIFPNLEHLITKQISTPLSLEQMPRLRLIELLSSDPRQLEIIEDIKRQKEKLKRQTPLIWISGFKENIPPDPIKHRCAYIVELFEKQFDYFEYSEPICVFPWPVELSLRHLTQKYQIANLEGIPNNFFDVFIHIRVLNVSVRVDNENLMRFIKKIKNLEELYLYHTLFNEKFLQEISNIQSIAILGLNDVFPRSVHYDVGHFLNLKNTLMMWIQSNRTSFRISVQVLIEFLKTTFTDFRGHLEMRSATNFLTISTDDEFTFSCADINVDEELNDEELDDEESDDEEIDHEELNELRFDSLDELICHVEKISRSKTKIILF